MTLPHSPEDILLQPITTLPEPLLEKILLSGTSTKDKKALRRTCKYFQKILDTNLVCLQLSVHSDKRQENFMKRMQQLPYLTTVGLRTVGNISTFNLNSLLALLPKHLTWFNFYGYDKVIHARELAGLPCLTVLCLNGSDGKVTGMEHISGLTRLQCNKPIGSLAHLAPTLKHLSIGSYNHVQGMNQLTNLEVLEMFRDVPDDFFQRHPQLPLKHLSIAKRSYEPLLYNPRAWKSAPTTLTCVTLGHSGAYRVEWLPASITHLRIMNGAGTLVAQLAAALPGLKCLDLCIDQRVDQWGFQRGICILKCVSMFTNLRSLCICIDDAETERELDRQTVLALPEVAVVVERGVEVNVIKTPEELLDLPDKPSVTTETAWTTPA